MRVFYSLVVLMLFFFKGWSQDTVLIAIGTLTFNTNDLARSNSQLTITEAKLHQNVLTVRYRGSENQKGWSRFFIITDSAGTEVLRKKFGTTNGTFKFALADLSKLKSHNRYQLSTYTYPLDPRLAMRIRIRRVNVCSLQVN